jgi:hypothetical protein
VLEEKIEVGGSSGKSYNATRWRTVTTSVPRDIILECGDAGINGAVANIKVTNHVSTDTENRNNRSTDLAL